MTEPSLKTDLVKITMLGVVGIVFITVAGLLSLAVTTTDGKVQLALVAVYLAWALGGVVGFLYLAFKTWNHPVRRKE